MNKIIGIAFVPFLVFAASTCTMAQDSSHTIVERPYFLGTSYYQDNHNLTGQDIEDTLLCSTDANVLELVYREQSYSTVAFIPALAGGFCLGIGYFSKPENGTLIVSGIVSILGAYILQNAASVDLHEAVQRYNSDLSSTSVGCRAGPPTFGSLRITFSKTF